MIDSSKVRKHFLGFLLTVSFASVMGFSTVYAQLPNQATITPSSTSTPSPTPTPTLSVEQRVPIIETQMAEVNEKLETPKKDIWDILTSISSLFSGVLIALIGLWATHVYNQRQLANERLQKSKELSVMQVQTIQTFMPQLQSGNEREVKSALLAISALGNSKLASDLAKLYQTEGAIDALSKMALSTNKAEAQYAEKSLAEIFQSLQKTVVWVSAAHGGACGFIISSSGYVISANLIDDNHKDVSFNIVYQDKTYQATLVSHDPSIMLNLFRMESQEATSGLLPSLSLANDDEVKPQDEVFILGFSGIKEKWDFNVGRVIETNVKFEKYPSLSFIRSEIETDVGYGGSPLVNKKGQIVGVHVMRDPLSKPWQESLTKFSIPTSYIKQMISKINLKS